MGTILLTGCAILKDDKLVLIRKSGREYWELPGGRAKEGEEELVATEKTAAQIGVTPSIIQQFTVFDYQKDGSNIEAAIFEADIPSESVFSPSEDVEEVAWFSIDSLPENVGDDVKKIVEEYKGY